MKNRKPTSLFAISALTALAVFGAIMLILFANGQRLPHLFGFDTEKYEVTAFGTVFCVDREAIEKADGIISSVFDFNEKIYGRRLFLMGKKTAGNIVSSAAGLVRFGTGAIYGFIAGES